MCSMPPKGIFGAHLIIAVISTTPARSEARISSSNYAVRRNKRSFQTQMVSAALNVFLWPVVYGVFEFGKLLRQVRPWLAVWP